ncbi:MAG: alpha/beta fold hydrolase [Acidobacteriota bacterium]
MVLRIVACLSILVLAASTASAAGFGGAETPAAPLRADGLAFAGHQDPVLAEFSKGGLFDELLASNRSLSGILDRVFTFEYNVPISGGRSLAVVESFSLRAWLRPRNRALLLLNGSAFNAEQWDAPDDAYSAHQFFGERGFFVFSVDYLGVDESTVPEDGFSVTYEVNREAMKELVRYIRFFRQVRKVDLFGEGFGGSMASEIAADGSRINSVSMGAMIYREVQGGPLVDPLFVGLLAADDDGYFFSPGEGSLIFTTPETSPIFIQHIIDTQGGLYPVDNFLVATERPFFDPSVARAPGQVIYGGLDFIAVREDIEDLAAEYGRDGARLVVREDVGHAYIFESPDTVTFYYQTVFDFIR